MMRKTILVVLRHSPYGSSVSKSALDTSLAAAAFDQPVNLLFIGDGVLQLIATQETSHTHLKSTAKQLASLPLYDIEHVFADADALDLYAIDHTLAPLPVVAVDAQAIAQMMDDSDVVLGF